jgi:hypothetical protein
MTDDQLQLDVTAELSWDPKVDGAAIAASVDSGTITLRGTVGSLREKHEAKKAAERVYGVTAVNNELQVRIPDKDRRDDTESCGDVLHALILDNLIPTTIGARNRPSMKERWIRPNAVAATARRARHLGDSV